MAALQDIKRRITSVKSTRQITKAMQLVAASKLRKYQEAATAPKVYVSAAEELLGRLGSQAEVAAHPLYQARPVKAALAIVIAGDRTLAGAYNSNVLRAFGELQVNTAVPMTVVSIGRQASRQLAKLASVTEAAAYHLETDDEDVEVAQPVLQQAITAFMSGEADTVDLVYTRFISSVRQEVTVARLLPVEPSEGGSAAGELEPNAEVLIDLATRRLLEARVLAAILESRASEQAARMVAMMNASDNAKDLIDDYTLAYNNARQAAITQELAEISSGAEAITN